MSDHRGAVAGGVVGCFGGYAACMLARGNPTLCVAACAGGAVVGVAIGAYLDNRRHRLEQAAREAHLDVDVQKVSVATPSPAEAAAPDASASTLPSRRPAGGATSGNEKADQENGLVLLVNVDGMFASGSAQPSPATVQRLRTLAAVYGERTDSGGHPRETKLLVTGHTDSSGDPAANQQLSQQRARAVAFILSQSGVPAADLYLKGAGSAQPAADNATPEGRARNRRVEILEIDNEPDLLTYAVARRQDRRNLAHSTLTAGPVVLAAPDAGPAAAPVVPSAPVPEVVQRRPPPVPRAEPAPAPRTEPPRTAPVQSGYAFDGRPASRSVEDVVQAVGLPSRHVRASLPGISNAEADEPIPPCYLDQPRVDGDVMRFTDGTSVEAHRTSQYMPGLYGTGWGAGVGETRVGFGPVAVLRDEAKPVGGPLVLVQAPGRNANRYTGVVNTFDGERGVFYRVYVKEPDAPLQCFDVALPKQGVRQSDAGWIYYREGAGWKQAAFHPALVSGK